MPSNESHLSAPSVESESVVKPFYLMKSTMLNRCDVCKEHLYPGDPIAWNPETRQTIHDACFRARFHPDNVANARGVSQIHRSHFPKIAIPND